MDSAATMHVVEPLDRSNTEYNSAVEDLTHQLQQRGECLVRMDSEYIVLTEDCQLLQSDETTGADF